MFTQAGTSKKVTLSAFIDFEILRTTYPKLDSIQKEIAHDVRAGKVLGRFLLAEVDSVITLGKRSQIQMDLPFPVYVTDRGGLETYHGPGQWVLFPVFPIQRGVKEFFRKSLEGTLEVVRTFDPRAKIEEGERVGIWLTEGLKVASIGVRIRDHVVQHGLSLNVYPTQESFRGINPCGIKGAQAGFLLRELETPERLKEKFEAIGRQWVQSVSRSLFGKPAKEIST